MSWRPTLLVLAMLTVVGSTFYKNVTLFMPPPWESFPVEAMNPGLDFLPLEGVLAENRFLQKAHRLFQGKLRKPETISFGNDGSMFIFAHEGILKTQWENGKWSDPELFFKEPEGRPLSGVVLNEKGIIVFCDPLIKGVRYVSLGGGKAHTLLEYVPNNGTKERIAYPDDIVVGSDGTFYFSDATKLQATQRSDLVLVAKFAMLQSGRTGRIIAYNPARNEAPRVLASGFIFANGVALSEAEDFLVFADSNMAQLYRHWLKGPKAGTTEVFVEKLPGPPDGVSLSSDGGFWVAIFTTITPVQRILLRFKFLRWIAVWTPQNLQPQPQKYGMLIKVDKDGNIVRSLQDPSGSVSFVTSVTEFEGKLYVGSLYNDFVGVIDLEENTHPSAVSSKPMRK